MSDGGGGSHDFISDVVCYHYPCLDGIFSALAAHLHLKQHGRLPHCRFFPLTVYLHHEADELQLTGVETVYLCDFCGQAGFFEAVARAAKRVVLLDHHKTTVEALQAPGLQLPSNVEAQHMDLDRSGATIALDYFKPNIPDTLRHVFKLVEDADLWRWELPGSREFHSGIGALELEYDIRKNPAIFDVLQDLAVDQVIESGRLLIDEEARVIAACLSTAFKVQLGGRLGREQHGWGKALAVRTPEGQHKIRSKLGNELALASLAQGLQPIGIVAYREAGMLDPSIIKLSLRGVGDEVDTTLISQAFGGGGHRLASSLLLPEEEFKTWLLGMGDLIQP